MHKDDIVDLIFSTILCTLKLQNYSICFNSSRNQEVSGCFLIFQTKVQIEYVCGYKKKSYL